MAATNIYLKLDGVDGESLDTDHTAWIELESWSWGVSNPATFTKGQGGQATQAHIAGFNIQKLCDKSSVTLFKNCTTGKHIPKATLSCLKLDGDTRVEYFKVDFTDLLVEGVNWSAAGGGHEIHESVSLVFSEFKETYKLQQDTGGGQGSVEFGYDLQSSKAT
jgi:type VI secretion system secreted protein Hcp